MNKISFEGLFELTVVRDGRTVDHRRFKNGIVNQGKNDVLDILLGTEAKHSWYFGLIGSGGTLSVTDTLSSKSWTEVTAYAGARPIYVPEATASGQSIMSAPADFIIDADATSINGAFLCSMEDDVYVGDSILWSTGRFKVALTLNNTETLKVTYKLLVK